MERAPDRSADPHHARRWLILVRDRHRAAARGARRDDREHRAAVRPARPRLLRRLPPVGDHRLRARVRQPAAARRAHRRPLRPQVDVHRRAARLRRRIGASAAPRRASGCSSSARALQGVFAAMLAPAALSLLTTTFTDPAERGKAFGVFGAIAGTGRRVRPPARRRADRDPRLALVPVRVDRLRRAGRDRRDPPAAPRAGPRPAAARRPRHADRVVRPVRARVRPLARRDATAGAIPSTIGFLVAAAVLLVGVRRAPAPGRAPAAAAARRRRPRPRRLVPRRSRTASAGHLRRLPVPDVLPPEHEGLTALETGLAFLPMSFSIVAAVDDRRARGCCRAPGRGR